MRKSMLATTGIILLSASILVACSSKNETANEMELWATSTTAIPISDPSSSPEPSATPSTATLEESVNPEMSSPQSSDRPETKVFGEQEGGVPGQEGTLARGGGFSLYIFKEFSLDSHSNRLSLTADPAYYAEIAPLTTDYNLADLKQQGQTELSTNGKPQDFSGELIEHPLGYAELYLQTSGENGLEDYVVWKNPEGEAYLFRIHNPKGELSGDFAPWLMVSLSTIVAN